MTDNPDGGGSVESLLATPDLASALESEPFRRFLDQIPIAIVVSDMKGREHIVYANPEFEKVSGVALAGLEGKDWTILEGEAADEGNPIKLAAAVTAASDFVGTFRIPSGDAGTSTVDVYSNIIQDDDGVPRYRLAALVDVGAHDPHRRGHLEQRLRDTETLLMEVQHRVKNNLQMITALIRIEARTAGDRIDTAPFERLAGRIESIQLLYTLLTARGGQDEVDLGVYLTEVATAVFRSHAVEGVRLDLKVDAYPVSVNVALPTGLVVNELLTNSLKHAFRGRGAGVITLHSVSDGKGCRVTVSDDGVGLREGVEWPMPGKLGALIVRSLRENAKAGVEVVSTPEKGLRVTITFTRAAAVRD
jgi:PAS domain S-box-containing protein